MESDLIQLCRNEGFTVLNNGEGLRGDGLRVEAFGEIFPLVHPFSIYGKLYREEKNPGLKYEYFKKLHDMLWPNDELTWNYWSERRFRYYCAGHRIMTWASGASTGKSVDAGKIALIEYLCSPKDTTVIVASTTLMSLESRVYGYIKNYLLKAKVPLVYDFVKSKPPSIAYNTDDTIHRISAMAAARGTDSTAIRNYIGRHPDRKLVLILDEATDLDECIMESIANLEAGDKSFQVLALGNSCSKYDLHGALSTPKAGWDSVSPEHDDTWETTQKGGICLYFSPYDSPAIHEKDPIRKKALSRFLITEVQLHEAAGKYGKTTDAYWRFVLGFWRNEATESTIISEQLLEEYKVDEKVTWAGIDQLQAVAGLDIALSSGGDQCLLQIGLLGTAMSGDLVLDLRGHELQFALHINPRDVTSPERQIAMQVIQKLGEFGIPLNALCIDCNGQGRAMADLIQEIARSPQKPIKVYSTQVAGRKSVSALDLTIKSPYDLWMQVKHYTASGQLKGLCGLAKTQLCRRKVKYNKTGKPVLEPKPEYKTRMRAVSAMLGVSPDEMDAAALCLQAAVGFYGFSIGDRRDVTLPADNGFEAEKLLAMNMGKVEEAVSAAPQSIAADFSGDIHDVVEESGNGLYNNDFSST